MDRSLASHLAVLIAAAVFIAGNTWAADLSSSNPDALVAAQCKGLKSTNFAGIEEAPTQLLSSEAIPETAMFPPHCRVTGYVSPQIGIELLLPLAGWNGKLVHLGSGGHAGSFIAGFCSTPLSRGYACLQSDMGHKGTGGDGLWALGSWQGKIDWGYRSTHIATVAGKAITEAFYQKPPEKSYFLGGSTGGRQALQEAQRFPWDFDGIIALAPPIRLADLYVTFAWGQRVTHDAAGRPLLTTADLKLLTEGAVARCDLDDGVRDGVISSPFECPFRASDLACKPAQTTACLTPEKVKAAEQVYSGPVDAQGRSLFSAGALPGSEYGDFRNAQNDLYGGIWGLYYVGKDGAPADFAPLTQEGLKYLFLSAEQAPDWTIQKFDFNSDYKRLDVMESLYDSSNPDLSRYQAAGGKLIIIHGLNDTSILPQWVIQYYEKVERVMGGRQKTQAFARLFLLPGVEHGPKGPGADTIDYFTYLERWVEQGKAPDKLVAYHLKPKERNLLPNFPLDPTEIEFSRPVYPYPIRAKYLGHGDPRSEASFGPESH